MSRDLADLQPDFRAKVETVQAKCLEFGYDMRAYFTLRDVFTQAKFWRQSRSTFQIEKALKMLVEGGAPWLAEVLDGVGPQHGIRVTGALPGFSWHQHGYAADHFLLVGGKAVWDPYHPGYAKYTLVAEVEGLKAGYWFTNRDAPHIQMFPSRVREKYSFEVVNKLMKEQFFFEQ